MATCLCSGEHDFKRYESLLPAFKSNLLNVTEHVVEKPTKPKVVFDGLTLGQQAAVTIVRTHFTSQSPEQLLLGIYGGPGTGKSIVVDYLLCMLRDAVRSTAFVGQAVFHVNGTTIHNLLKVPFNLASSYDLSDARIEELHNSLRDVRHFIIDEISMVSKQLFMWISMRLRQAFRMEHPLAGEM